MHLNFPEVLERTKDYLLKLQCLEDDDTIEVDSTTLASVNEIAADVRKELNGKLLYSSQMSFQRAFNSWLNFSTRRCGGRNQDSHFQHPKPIHRPS